MSAKYDRELLAKMLDEVHAHCVNMMLDNEDAHRGKLADIVHVAAVASAFAETFREVETGAEKR